MIRAPFSKVLSKKSALWGSNGELWNPESRLPDFSWAGYHSGDQEPPTLPPGISVKDYGAVGDGKHDDTEAFLKALGEAEGAIEIPAGRYLITKILEINRSGIVLRGAGPEQTRLVCPVPLSDIRPDWGATTGGRRTSNYSWSGGMVWIQGNPKEEVLAAITQPSRRGQNFLELSSAAGLGIGQRVQVHQQDNPDNSLARHLYSEDPGDTAELKGSSRARLSCKIVSIRGNRVEIDRPLRFDVRAAWCPELRAFAPDVTECGVEHLGFEFPGQVYAGHFNELGHNAVAIKHAADCWVRNLHIHNADSGIFVSASFCSLLDIRLTCSRENDETGCSGHHGAYIAGDDNLFTRFDYQTRFIHDISVSLGAGNVFSEGQGTDLCFDHHKRAPYENLFTRINTGRGSRPWHCGGGAALGKHCAARGTFWNIGGEQPLPYPFPDFGPASMNLVGIKSEDSPETQPGGKWLEGIEGDVMKPDNLHLAQLQKRKSL